MVATRVLLLSALLPLPQVLSKQPQLVKVFDLTQDAPYFNIGSSKPFDHYNFDGFNGGISSLCFTTIDNRQRRRRGNVIPASVNIIAGLTVYYAGVKKEDTPTSSWKPIDQGCFQLIGGEVLSKLEYKFTTHFPSSITDGDVSVRGDSLVANGIRLHTKSIADGSEARHSQWFGCESCFPSGMAYTHKNFTAPDDTHIVGFKGLDRSDHDIGWLSNLQAYVGSGNVGTGSWNVVNSGVPGVWRNYKMSVCTKYSTNKSETDTKQWATSVENELTVKFSFFDVSTSEKNIVSTKHSGSVVRSSYEAFERTECIYTDAPCNETYLFQFQFATSYRNQGKDLTDSSIFACADRPPCCLPLTYSRNPSDCDLQKDAPNFCKKTDPLLLV